MLDIGKKKKSIKGMHPFPSMQKSSPHTKSCFMEGIETEDAP